MGLDLGTANIGVVVLNESKIVYEARWNPPYKGVERLAWIDTSVFEAIEEYKVKAVAIEGYSYMSRWRAHDLGEVGGIIRLGLYRRKIDFEVVPPPTLKKFVSGKGNANKEFVVLSAFRRWGAEFPDTHRCDAYCLCRYLQAQQDKE